MIGGSSRGVILTPWAQISTSWLMSDTAVKV